MEELQSAVLKEMTESFMELCAIHVETILKRDYQFTLDDEDLPVTFKFVVSNAGKVVRITPSMSMPGQKITDGGSTKTVDLDQPELLNKKKK
jgi:hypothetical protein